MLEALTKRLETFVLSECLMRNDTHGYNYTKAIYERTKSLMDCDKQVWSEDDRAVAITVAWLHNTVGVYDHDFATPDRIDRLTKFLEEFAPCCLLTSGVAEILSIIYRVGYKREKQFGNTDWNQFIGPIGSLNRRARDIVSDACKCEALGRPGLDRCRAYFLQLHRDAKCIDIQKAVRQHYSKKLSVLATPMGMHMAENLIYKLHKVV
jgi:hypothetical protein